MLLPKQFNVSCMFGRRWLLLGTIAWWLHGYGSKSKKFTLVTCFVILRKSHHLPDCHGNGGYAGGRAVLPTKAVAHHNRVHQRPGTESPATSSESRLLLSPSMPLRMCVMHRSNKEDRSRHYEKLYSYAMANHHSKPNPLL